jgi:hypothetical protein
MLLEEYYSKAQIKLFPLGRLCKQTTFFSLTRQSVMWIDCFILPLLVVDVHQLLRRNIGRQTDYYRLRP